MNEVLFVEKLHHLGWRRLPAFFHLIISWLLSLCNMLTSVLWVLLQQWDRWVMQRHESEGMRAMLPSWPNIFPLIASPQPTAFAKTHKIQGRRLKGIFQRPQLGPCPRMSPNTRSHSFNSENRSWELTEKCEKSTTSKQIEQPCFQRLGLKSQISSPPSFTHNHWLHHEGTQVPGSEGRRAAELKELQR